VLLNKNCWNFRLLLYWSEQVK